MKKRISIAITALLAVSLVSCGTAPSESTNDTQNTVAENSVSSTSEDNNDDESEEDTEDINEDESEDEDDTEEYSSNSDTAEIDKSIKLIEPTVIFDKNGIKVTADNLEYTSYEAKLDVTIENTSDTKYKYYAGAGGYACNSVNGYMFNGGYATGSVDGGKKTIETVKFSYDEMFIYGIDKIAEIQLGIMFEDDDYNRIYGGDVPIKTTAYDGYDFNKNYFVEQVKSKAIEKAYKCKIDDYKEEEFFNSDGIKVLSAMTLTNKDGDSSLALDIYNDSSEIIYVNFGDLNVNKLAMPYGMYGGGYILPKKHMISVSNIQQDDIWPVLGIEKVNDVQFEIKLSNKTHNEQETINTKKDVIIKYSEGTSDFMSTGKEILNNDYVRIIFKGFTKSYDDLIMYLICENKTGDMIQLSDDYDSLSINDMMTDYSYFGNDIAAGSCGVMEIRLYDEALKKNKISSEDDIEKLEITLKILNDSYDELDTEKMIYTK